MSTPSGLSSADVAARRARGQRNVVRRETSRTYAGIVRSNVLNVFNITVFLMAAVLASLFGVSGDERTLYDAITITGIAFINTVIGIVQEIRAKVALDRVNALARPTATVVRDGKTMDVRVDELVVDDVIQVTRGDQIPADGRVLVSQHCEVDESLLTGESVYIEKPEAAPLLSGSFCVAGQCLMVAEKVGEESYVRGLTREVRAYTRFLTPLQRDIDRIVQILMFAAAAMAFLVVAQAFARDRASAAADSPDRLEAFIETTRSVAAIVTSTVPMGLILLSTVAFSLGVFRISRQGALVQKLNAIESFSHIDVLCMDKTGTLTRNEQSLAAIHTLAGVDEGNVRALAGAFAARCTEQNATMLAIAKACPAPPAEVRAVDEVPFNSRDKLSAIALEWSAGAPIRRLFLGALEVLGPRLAPEQAAFARAIIEGDPGLRHVVLAELADEALPLRRAADERAPLCLLAVLSFADALRSDAPDVLRAFAARGIALKVVSGDAPETVRSVARAAGWQGDTERVVTGPEIDAMPPEALAQAAADVSLFARVSPQNKRALVASLQAQGRYVAMVGDGVNDVLALKKAQLGVAMGAGNRMSRDVSDIVLLQNDFAMLPRVLEEGATIVHNVQSSAKLFLTKNVFSLTLIVATGFIGLAFPFVPRHVSVLNFFAITVPALLITFTHRQLEVPSSFLRDVLRFTGISGGLIALAGLVSYFVSVVGLDASPERARTVLLTQLVLLTLLNFVLVIGGAHLRANLKRNAILAVFPLAFGALYLVLLLTVTGNDSLEAVATFLEMERLEAVELTLALGVTAVTGALMVFIQRRVLARALEGRVRL
jgi:cation-transporting ATPase E